MHKDFNVLFSAVGRRVQLVECFRDALRSLGLRGAVLGMDSRPTLAPAAYHVDQVFQVPPCASAEFVPQALELCRTRGVRLLVPTVDPELPVYACQKESFLAAGTEVAISSPEVVRITGDKVETNRVLREVGLPAPRQASVAEVLQCPDSWVFPVIVKPRRGSSSIGVRRVESAQALTQLENKADDLIVEELLSGEEHTVNAFVDASGRCLAAVPHRRLEVRGGEVSKAVTVKNRAVMEQVRTLAEALGGARGPLNVQCFVDAAGVARFTEINARFGGGFPLACRAGADFPKWMMEELLGRSNPPFDSWEDGLTMLRYDQAVYVPRKEGAAFA